MAITKFGQYVYLLVHDGAGVTIFETDSLRVDFDVRHIDKFSRCKVDIYNLAPKTIKALSSGDNYVTVSTALHDETLTPIIDHFYISNVLEVPNAPHSITSLFTFSSIRVNNLERQIDTIVALPSLRSIVSELTRLSGFNGRVLYKHFPATMVDHIPPRPYSHHKGSLQTCLERLGEQFGFNMYTEGKNILLLYKPNARNVEGTGLYFEEGSIKLSTRDMRTNPKIGPATLSIDANLNKEIKPGSVLDISDLLYADTDTPQDTLEIAKDFLKDKVGGFSKYQALTVQHKGSNFDKTWVTSVMAVQPTKGNNMPTNIWFK